MDLDQIALLTCVGGLLGLVARYLLALHMQAQTAIVLGIVTMVIGPWLLDEIAVVTKDWSPGQIVSAATALVIAIGFGPGAVTRSRRWLRRRRSPVHRLH